MQQQMSNKSNFHIHNTRRIRKVKIHRVWADREILYAYYGNNALNLEPLPVSRARLTVVEPILFEWDVYEMAAPIQSPDKCEVSSIIRFLNAKCERPAEVHKQIVAVYGNVMNRQKVSYNCGNTGKRKLSWTSPHNFAYITNTVAT